MQRFGRVEFPVAAQCFLVRRIVRVVAIAVGSLAFPITGHSDDYPLLDPVSDSVGASYGEFRVDESGQATYSMPVFAPPGTAGVQPKLALTYSSGGGNGPLGKGWSISGQSAITRCRKTREHGDFFAGGVPVDGNPIPVRFTNEDAFCLDGQRLILVAGGSYGDSGAEYRLEFDPFTKIISHGGNNGASSYSGPSYFTVRRKDGSSSEYGNTLDSRIERSACTSAGGNCTNFPAAAWALNRFEDSTGNYILYAYEETGFAYVPRGVDYQLKSVTYTGKRQLPGQTGGSSAPYAGIYFNYQPIQTPNGWETENAFLGGTRFTLTQYLHSIEVRDQIDGSPRVLRYYKPTYEISASGSRYRLLRSIKECRDSSEAVCYRPTEFRWSDQDNVAYRFDASDAVNTAGTGVRVGALRVGDVDGDGRMDVVWFRRDDPACPGGNRLRVGFGDRVESGGQSRLTLVTPDHANFCTTLNAGNNALAGGIGLLDFDGDGRDDLIIADPSGTPGGRWRLYRSLGRPAGGGAVFGSTDLMNVTIPIAGSQDQAQFGDFNGDGLVDMIYPSGSESLAIRYLTRNAAGNGFEFGPAYALTNFLPADCSVPGTSCNLEIFRQTTAAFGVASDFNGDGRGDLVLRVTLSSSSLAGQELPPVTMYPTDTLADDHPEIALGFESQRFYAFAMGPKSDAGLTQAVSQYGVTLYVRNDLGPQDPRHFQFADVNGDSLADLFYTIDASTENFRFALSTGATFEGPSGNVFSGQIRNVKNREHVRLADIDGDGRTEVLYPTDSSSPCPGSVSGDRVFRYRRYSTRWNGMEDPADSNPHASAPCVPGGGAKAGDLNDAEYLFADFDGDGALDFIKLRDRLGSSGGFSQPQLLTSRAGTSSRFKRRDAIVRITNGNGARTEITYQPQTNKAIYRRLKNSRNERIDGRGAPVQDLLSSEYVVSQVSSSAPTASNPTALSTIWYRYTGGRAQAGGRGFLGYFEINTFDVNPVSGRYTASQQYYRQDFPFIGASLQTGKYVLPAPPTRGSAALDACALSPEASMQDCFYDPAESADDTHPSLGSLGAVQVQANATLWACQGTGGAELCNPTPPTTSCPSFPDTVTGDLPLLVEDVAPASVFGPRATAAVSQQPIFPYAIRTLDLDFSPENSGKVTRHVCGLFAYGDGYGNATSTTVATFNAGNIATEVARKRTLNAYVNDAVNWRLGRLMSSAIEDTRGGITRSRITDFDYEVDRTGYVSPTDTGLLKGEWLQKGIADDQELRTLYTLDPYGNRTGEFTCSRLKPNGTSLSDAECRNASLVQQRPGTGTGVPVVSVHRYQRHTYTLNGRFLLATYAPFYGASSSNNVNEQVVLTVGHDEFGHVTQQTDANGLVTRAVYGGLGRPYYSHDGYGKEVFVTYRWCGSSTNEVLCPNGAKFRQQTVTDGAPTIFAYFDVLGREYLTVKQAFNAGTTGQHWAAACKAYDAHGRVVAASIPFFLSSAAGTGTTPVFTTGSNPCASVAATTTIYDGLGRITTVTAPDSSAITTVYLDRITTVTDARGRQTRQEKNALGEIVTVVQGDAATGSVTAPGALTVTHEYDPQGNLRFQRRNAGNGEIQTERQYDALGRLTRLIDPDRGTTNYSYNAAGELIAQTDPRGQRIEQDWDALGRIWCRRAGLQTAFTGPTCDSPGGSLTFDKWSFDIATQGFGLVGTSSRITPGGQITHTLTYDRGRFVSRQADFDTASYTEQTTYDTFGRIETVRDASAGVASYTYGTHGYLISTRYSLRGGTEDYALYEILAQDAWGNSTQERRGGVLITNKTYDTLRGWVDTVNTGSIQSWNYDFDVNGNLTRRDRAAGALVESLVYDKLDRLTTINRSGTATTTQTVSMAYDQLGNLCSKGPSGAVYIYAGRAGCPGAGGSASARPHAVTTIGSTTYNYDALGLLTNADATGTTDDRHFSYDTLEQATSIKRGSSVSPANEAQFAYAPDGSRYRRVDRVGGAITRTTRYIGNVEVIISGGVTETKRYLGGDAIVTTFSNQPGVVQDRYALPDHLGSVDVIVDAGAIVESTSFDAWGQRRSASNWQGTGTPLTTTTHGFTGHEHVDALGVIHMNGRIYDPTLARFVQADPVLDSGIQGLNRYSYVLNNPLSATDPTGHLSTHEWGQVFMGVVMAIGTGGASMTWQGAAMTGSQQAAAQATLAAGMGAMAGAIQSESLKGALWGAFSALSFYGIGSYFDSAGWTQASGKGVMGTELNLGGYASKIVAHGVAGGAMQYLQGGKFGSGFAAAGVTEAFSGGINRLDPANPGFSVQRVTAAALIGGSASAMTGGKFANGALTAAFSNAFNEQMHYIRTADGQMTVKAPGQDLEWGSWPSLSQDSVDFAVGMADSLSFGVGRYLRGQLGIDGGVSMDSAAYRWGEMSSLMAGGVRLAYAGGAMAVRGVGRAVGGMQGARIASTGRNALKVAARGGLFPNYRRYSFATIVERYRGIAADIINASGRTSRYWNAAGVMSGGGAAANRMERCSSESGC